MTPAQVTLSADELDRLTEASARIEIQGGRYPNELEAQTNLWCVAYCGSCGTPVEPLLDPG